MRLLTDRELFERRVMYPVFLVGSPLLVLLIHRGIL